MENKTKQKKNIGQGVTTYFVLYNIIPLILTTLQCDMFYYSHFNKLLRKWKLGEAKSLAQAYGAYGNHKLY